MKFSDGVGQVTAGDHSLPLSLCTMAQHFKIDLEIVDKGANAVPKDKCNWHVK